MTGSDENLNEQQELFEHHRIVVDPGQSLLRIDKFLVNRLIGISRSRIQAAAMTGNIIVNDNAVKPNYKVKPGDIIQVMLPHPRHESELLPEDIPLNIVYEDDDLLVVDKAAGMVVHPGIANYTGTLVNALMWHLKDNAMFSSGEVRPGLAHRIDKNTSGLLVVAKNEFALNHLGRQFFNHTTGRIYNCLVWGLPDPPDGTITGHIGRSPKNRKVMYVFPDGSSGKEAVTHYRVMEDLGYISLVECRLETGRTHQIRAHMSWYKHPLFNDSDYGGDKILKGTTFTKYQQFVRNCFEILPRQALHARTLAFDHPVTGKRMEFETPIPEDMSSVINKWRTYITARNEG